MLIMKHKYVKCAIIIMNKKKVNDMQNSNKLDEFTSEASEASEENKKQPLHGIRKKLTFSSETEAFSAFSRIKFGDVEHYLKNGICSSLLSNFIWSTNKMAINLHRATTQGGGEQPVSPLLFSIQHFGLPILQFLVSFILIAARVVDTPLVILTTPIAVLLTKDKRWDVFLACGKNFSQGIISIPFMVWGASSSIFVLFYDFFKGKKQLWEDPLPDYIVRCARLKFDPRTQDRTDDNGYVRAKDFVKKKRLSRHQRLLLYRERPDLDMSKPLKNPIDHEITTLSNFFDKFHPTEERKLFSCMYTTRAVSKGIMSNILSKGYSISVKDINCEIRYKDNSLELIKSIDGGLLIYTTTNSDEVIQQYVTIEGEKQEIKIYNTEKKAWEEAKVTKEFKRTDAENIIEFSSIDNFKASMDSLTTLSDFFDNFYPIEDDKLITLWDFFDNFYPIEDDKLIHDIKSVILSGGYSVCLKDINCEIRYKDNSLELVKSINGGFLIYTMTNSDEVILQYVTIEGEKQEIKIYNTEKKAWEEAKVTKEFKRTDAKNIIEFSSIDNFKASMDSFKSVGLLPEAQVPKPDGNAHTQSSVLAPPVEQVTKHKTPTEIQCKASDLEQPVAKPEASRISIFKRYVGGIKRFGPYVGGMSRRK